MATPVSKAGRRSETAAGFDSYVLRDWKARRHGPDVGCYPNDPERGGFDSYAFRDITGRRS